MEGGFWSEQVEKKLTSTKTRQTVVTTDLEREVRSD